MLLSYNYRWVISRRESLPRSLAILAVVQDFGLLESGTYALFCTFLHKRKQQIFWNQVDPHSLSKKMGGGVPFTHGNVKKYLMFGAATYWRTPNRLKSP